MGVGGGAVVAVVGGVLGDDQVAGGVAGEVVIVVDEGGDGRNGWGRGGEDGSMGVVRGDDGLGRREGHCGGGGGGGGGGGMENDDLSGRRRRRLVHPDGGAAGSNLGLAGGGGSQVGGGDGGVGLLQAQDHGGHSAQHVQVVMPIFHRGMAAHEVVALHGEVVDATFGEGGGINIMGIHSLNRSET